MSLLHQMLDDIKTPAEESQQWVRIKRRMAHKDFTDNKASPQVAPDNPRKVPARRRLMRKQKPNRPQISDIQRVYASQNTPGEVSRPVPKKKLQKMSYTKQRSSQENNFATHGMRFSQKVDLGQRARNANELQKDRPATLALGNFSSQKDVIDPRILFFKKPAPKKDTTKKRKIKQRKRVLRPSRPRPNQRGKDPFIKKLNVQSKFGHKIDADRLPNFELDIGPDLAKFNSERRIGGFTSATDNRLTELESEAPGKRLVESMNRRLIGLRKRKNQDEPDQKVIAEVEESEVIDGIGRANGRLPSGTPAKAGTVQVDADESRRRPSGRARRRLLGLQALERRPEPSF